MNTISIVFCIKVVLNLCTVLNCNFSRKILVHYKKQLIAISNPRRMGDSNPLGHFRHIITKGQQKHNKNSTKYCNYWHLRKSSKHWFWTKPYSSKTLFGHFFASKVCPMCAQKFSRRIKRTYCQMGWPAWKYSGINKTPYQICNNIVLLDFNI